MTKRVLSGLGLILSVGAIALTGLFLTSDFETQILSNCLQGTSFMTSMTPTSFVVLFGCMLIIMSVSSWMNFISVEKQYFIRQFGKYDDSDGN